jgi:uncharacterized protein
MQNMNYSVNAQVSLAVVETNTQAEHLPERFEPLLVNPDADSNDNVSLTELIEDELILALPAVALHKVQDCPAGEKFGADHHPETQNDDAAKTKNTEPGTELRAGCEQTSPENVARPNPFAVLARLKVKPDE